MSTLAADIPHEYFRQKCAERAAQSDANNESESEPLEFLLPGEEPEPRIQQGSFASQAQIWLQSLSERRSPVKPATLSTWTSIVRAHIASSPVLGNTLLKSTDNRTLKEFVDELVEKELSARSIRDILLVAKLIVKSAMDSRGNLLHKWEFNHDYINAPVVGPANAPCAKRENLEDAIRCADPKFRALYILLASSGLRLGESLSLKIGDDGVSSCWDRANSLLHIRRSVWRGTFQEPKTRAAVRIVDLCAEANELIASWVCNRTEGFLFESRNKTPLSATTVYRFGLSKTEIPGAHSLRRFRATRLAETEVPMPLIKMWLGHSKNDISENYMRPSEMASRHDWCEKAGLGFSL